MTIAPEIAAEFLPAVVHDDSYLRFSAEMHARMIRERVATSAVIEISHRCPLECVHCYNNLPMGDLQARNRELSYEEHCRLLDQMAEAGCLWLLYTGGEIFARKDFPDIYIYAKKKGFLITLFTNGNLITPAIADFLVEWRPFSIEITLYGASAETYEKLTGIPGSWARCMRGIGLLLERGLPLSLKTVAISINRHELGEMRRLAGELGVPFKFDAMMNPRIDCSRSPLEVRLEPWEIVKLDLEDPERVAAWKDLNTEYGQPPADAGEVYHCGGGVTSFAVDPYGKMSICVLSHRDHYDLRGGTFADGWNGFLNGVRHRKATRITKCTECRIQAMCGMCPANGELESGDPESPVDFLCRLAHLRAKAMGIAVPEHGDCEYCEGGSGHSEILLSLDTLHARAGETWAEQVPAGSPFPILAERRSGGSCSSCGH